MTCSESSPGPLCGELILALNGAEDRLQIAIGENQNLVHSQEWVLPGQVMRILAPAVHDALARLGKTPEQVRGLAVVRGPGGFTGLRLCLSLALGFSKGSSALLAGIDYLPLLAASAPAADSGSLWVLTHARRGQVHIQGFDSKTLAPLSPPVAASLEQAMEAVSQGPLPGRLLGSGLRRNLPFFSDRLKNGSAGQAADFVFLPRQYDSPRPDKLFSAALEAKYGPGPIEPLYLRSSDAEENLDSIARKRGLDPEKARQDLNRLSKS